MLHLVQRNLFKPQTYDRIIHALERLGCEYKSVDVLPFTTEVFFLNEEGDDLLGLDLVTLSTNNIYCWGSVKFAHISKQYDWSPGSMFNENHDYRVYSQYYKENMLNYDSIIIGLGEELVFDAEYFFARPCQDTKLFTGQCFSKDAWRDFAKWHLTNSTTSFTEINESTPIQVSKMKVINQEIRFFIIDGKIVTASQYVMNERTIYAENHDEDVHAFVNDMIKIYQPAEAFVMDIAVTPNGLKIVEINCINCSGLYDCDVQKIVMALENKFNND